MANPNNHPWTARFAIRDKEGNTIGSPIDGYGKTPRTSANAALFIARQMTVPHGGKVRCELLEHNMTALFAFGDTADAAADEACRMHKKAACGGGR